MTLSNDSCDAYASDPGMSNKLVFQTKDVYCIQQGVG